MKYAPDSRNPFPKSSSFVAIFWDIANCAPPKDQSALRVAQGLRCQFTNQANRYVQLVEEKSNGFG
jgi:hypothetical protein